MTDREQQRPYPPHRLHPLIATGQGENAPYRRNQPREQEKQISSRNHATPPMKDEGEQ